MERLAVVGFVHGLSTFKILATPSFMQGDGFKDVEIYKLTRDKALPEYKDQLAREPDIARWVNGDLVYLVSRHRTMVLGAYVGVRKTSSWYMHRVGDPGPASIRTLGMRLSYSGWCHDLESVFADPPCINPKVCRYKDRWFLGRLFVGQGLCVPGRETAFLGDPDGVYVDFEAAVAAALEIGQQILSGDPPPAAEFREDYKRLRRMIHRKVGDGWRSGVQHYHQATTTKVSKRSKNRWGKYGEL